MESSKKPSTRRSTPMTDKEKISEEEQTISMPPAPPTNATITSSRPIILENSTSQDGDIDTLSDHGQPADDSADCETHSSILDANSTDDDVINFAADNNNRFALILERMDMLEKENEILKARNQDHEANQKKHIEETYEKEIRDTRKLLDDMAQDKANMELDLARLDHDLKDVKKDSAKNLGSYNKADAELDELKERYAAKDRHNSELKREVKDLQKAFSSITIENRKAIEERKQAFAERDIYEADSKKLRKDNKDLKEKIAGLEKKCASLKKEVDDTRTSCQDEALKRVNCENQIATLSETLDFERKISKDKLMECRGNDSFAQNVESAVASRLSQALEEMRADHEIELVSTVNKLKYQYSAKLQSQEEKIHSLQEKERELSSRLKNNEITMNNYEKSKRSEIATLKKQVETLESDVETLKSDSDYHKSEKDKVFVELQSRQAVWKDNELEYNETISNLKETLDSKSLQEQQLRSELNKFGALMSAAEDKHKVPSPDRSQMRQARKQSKARNKRRLSQMKKDEQQSSSSFNFTPQAKRAYTGPTLVPESEETGASPNSVEKSSNGEQNSENKECRIM